jgi:hypothetical protein
MVSRRRSAAVLMRLIKKCKLQIANRQFAIVTLQFAIDFLNTAAERRRLTITRIPFHLITPKE